MNLQRLLHTRIADIADRGRQEISKSIDRMRVSGETTGSPRGRLSARSLAREGRPASSCAVSEYPAVHQTLARFREKRGQTRFFAGCEVGVSPQCFKELFADHVRTVIALADKACAGKIDLLGFTDVKVGHPIDWHRDPISGRRAPLRHWSAIDALNVNSIGDSKNTWELNRHQWFVHLGQAYWFTCEEHYAETWARCLRSWIESNPVDIGINWTSSLELGYRLIAWCWSLNCLRESRVVTEELFATIEASVACQATHIERYLSLHYSPNTHLTGEALGLLYAGLMFPRLAGAQRWCRVAQRILMRELRRQVHEDGVYFEQSTCYQRYTVETYLHWLILAGRNGMEVPLSATDTVQQMIDVLLALRHPDGTMPQIGDTDGGQLLPLVRRGAHDFRGLFATAAAHFRRPDYAWAAGGPAPEVMWLLGSEGQEALNRIVPAIPHRTSQLFRQGGYAVMRDGWNSGGQQLIFDFGPLGCPVSSGHGHADLLSVQCMVRGEVHLIDPGTYCYTKEPVWRDYFRSTAAHSTITIDDLGQAVPDGPFAWERRPRARLLHWHTAADCDFAEAQHEAYTRLRDPVVHRRRVLFVKPRFWVIVDDLNGRDAHSIQLRYQFATTNVSTEENGWIRSRGSRGALLVRNFCSTPAKLELRQGSVAPIQGWRSPDYGVIEAASTAIFSTLTVLPLRTVTLLVAAELGEEAPRVSTDFENDSMRIEVLDSKQLIIVTAADVCVQQLR